jgi:hypothetical protein
LNQPQPSISAFAPSRSVELGLPHISIYDRLELLRADSLLISVAFPRPASDPEFVVISVAKYMPLAGNRSLHNFIGVSQQKGGCFLAVFRKAITCPSACVHVLQRARATQQNR